MGEKKLRKNAGNAPRFTKEAEVRSRLRSLLNWKRAAALDTTWAVGQAIFAGGGEQKGVVFASADLEKDVRRLQDIRSPQVVVGDLVKDTLTVVGSRRGGRGKKKNEGL